MINLEFVRKRMNTAVDMFESYSDAIVRDGNEYIVAGKYTVNLHLASCTCKDYEIRKDSTPCKHLIMVWIYTYAETHQESDPFH